MLLLNGAFKSYFHNTTYRQETPVQMIQTRKCSPVMPSARPVKTLTQRPRWCQNSSASGTIKAHRLSGAAAQSTEDGNRMKLLDEKLIPSQVKELEAMRLASVRVGSRADG